MKRLLLGGMLLILTGSGWGQNYFQRGNKYVSFEVNRSPAIIGGYFFDDRSAVHLGAILNIDGERETTGFGLQLGVDRYTRYAVLTPFWGAGVKYEINPVAYGEGIAKGTRISIDGHWGIHLFVLKGLAIAGKLGLELLFDSPQDRDTTTSLGTFSSGMEIRFFF